jgi:NSS family neurotransmitter:Na+ symporter
MPAVFSHLGGGQFFSILFFFLLLVAALTSSVSLMEVVTSFFIDEFNLPRIPVSIVMAILMFALGIVASLSLGVWQEYTLFGMNFFRLLDYVTSHLMMPFGGIMISLLVGWKAWRQVAARLASDKGKLPWWWSAMKGFCRYIAPLLILLVLVQNL